MVDPGRNPPVGKHGYNPYKVPEMKATYFACPAFKQHQQIRPFVNINIYPAIAEILDLKITAPIDGNIKVLGKTLNKNNKTGLCPVYLFYQAKRSSIFVIIIVLIIYHI